MLTAKTKMLNSEQLPHIIVFLQQRCLSISLSVRHWALGDV